MGKGCLTLRHGPFTPRKENRYPFHRRLRRAQGRCGQERKTSPPPVFDPRTVQPVVSPYTGQVIPGPLTEYGVMVKQC